MRTLTTRSTRLYLRLQATSLGPVAAGYNRLRVCRGARQVPRGHTDDLERRAGPRHGVHRVWPDVSDADLLTGGVQILWAAASHGPAAGMDDCVTKLIRVVARAAAGARHPQVGAYCGRSAVARHYAHERWEPVGSDR
jgi:hypothetical protein